MIIPVLRSFWVIYTRNPDLTFGAITCRRFGPVAKCSQPGDARIFTCISGYHFFMAGKHLSLLVHLIWRNYRIAGLTSVLVHFLPPFKVQIGYQLNAGANVSIRVRAAGSSSPTVARKFGCFIPDPRNVQRSA